jgi:hypothetical protein
MLRGPSQEMIRMTRTTLLTATAAWALGALQHSALADINNVCRINVDPNFSGGSGPDDQIVTQPGTIDLSGSATGGFNSSGSATCHVEYGVVQVTGLGDGSVNSAGAASFRDVVTITSPGVPSGTSGTLTYSVHVDGTLIATSGYSDGTWTVSTLLGGPGYDMGHSGTFRSPDLVPSGPGGDPFGTYSVTISFQYGNPMQLDVEFSGLAQASISYTGPGHAYIGSPLTLTWEGISNVTAGGSPVSSFLAAGQSGTNWGGAYIPPPHCGSADFNCDGDIGTDADIESFFACLSGTCPPPPCTSSADFNGDGDVGTDADIEAFFRVLAGGTC